MSTLSESSKRIVCIDRMRGILVFCMVFFQCAEDFVHLDPISRVANHRMDRGVVLFGKLTLADLVAPMFFLVIALNYLPSLKRRIEQDGRQKAYMHYTMRYLAIMGFGSCLITIEKIFGGNYYPISLILGVGVVITALIGIVLLAALALKNGKLKEKASNALVGILASMAVVNLVTSIYNIYPLFFTDDSYCNWGVLQAIGGAGLLVLLFAESSTLVRGILAALFFGIFSFIHALPNHMQLIDEEVQGGVLGVFSWGAMLLCFTVMADLFYRDRAAKLAGKKGFAANTYLIGTAVLAVLSVPAWAWMRINKGSVSPGFVLVTMPVAALCFWLISLTDRWNPRFPIIQWWGYSPILMFLFQYLTQGVVFSLLPGILQWPTWAAAAYVLLMNGGITWVAYRMYQNKTVVKV